MEPRSYRTAPRHAAPTPLHDPASPEASGTLSTADVAALDDPSGKAAEANISLNQFGAARIAPAIETASVGATLEKIRLLRSEINAVNATMIAPRVECGSLGQSLRGIHAALGSNKEKEPAVEGFRRWRDDLRCHGAPKASCWRASRNAATLRLDAAG